MVKRFLRLKKVPLLLICGSALGLAALVVTATLVGKPAARPPSVLTLSPALTPPATASSQAINSKSASPTPGLAGLGSRAQARTELTKSSDMEIDPSSLGEAFVSRDGTMVVLEARQRINGKDFNEALLRNRATDAITRVSKSPDGGPANGTFYESLAMSSDGRHLVFESDATNLVRRDNNRAIDIFMRDLVAHTTVRVSVASTGEEANGRSDRPAISGDGRYVLFDSEATNLVAGDRNAVADVFLRDLSSGVTSLISGTQSGVPVGGNARAISDDGKVALFSSSSSSLVENDTNNAPDLFTRNLQTGQIRRVSMEPSGKQLADGADYGALTPDGAELVFGDEYGRFYVEELDSGSMREVAAGNPFAPEAVSPHAETIVGGGGVNGDFAMVFHDGAWLERVPGGYATSVTDDGRFVGMAADGPTGPGQPSVYDVSTQTWKLAWKW